MAYTEDLCEGGIITSSDGYLGRDAYKMFDNIIGDWSVSSFQTYKDANAFLGYQFSAPKAISKYVLTSSNGGPTSAWTAWVLQGSVDGIVWEEVHNVPESRDWGMNESRTFVFENTTSYLYYKFIPSNNQGSDWYAMCELEMMASTIPKPASNIYHRKRGDNLRGKAAEGFIRPTIAEFFTSMDFEEIIPPVTGTGGIITEITDNDINYRVHTFLDDGIFTPGGDLDVEYLVVAGGGGSSGHIYGAGGGAGGFRTGFEAVTAQQSYNVIIGDGGAGGISHTIGAYNGGNSMFSSILSLGGGSPGPYGAAGKNGGSGGGGTAGGGLGTPGQGNDGGDGTSGGAGGGGGGGGASEVGAYGVDGVGGNGGDGLSSSITGVLTWYAGGGGGATTSISQGTGGVGGGGASNVNGTANTGGGAGARSGAAGDGFIGGSGIVVIRYAI